MIQVWIAKKIVGSIINAIQKKHDLKKIDDYVNKPNELDKQMKQIVKTNSKILRENEEMQKDIAILKRDSHPPQEYICCRKCGCKIAKTKEK
jgi:predicted methyltransferase